MSVDSSLFAQLVPLNALSAEYQTNLAKTSSIHSLQAGQHIFKVGDPLDQAIFLLAGEIQLEDSTGKRVSSLSADSPGALHRIAHHSPRKVAAKCLSNVRYLSVDANLLDIMLTWAQANSLEVNELSPDHAVNNDDWMAKLLQMHVFQMVPPANLQAMFMRMTEIDARAGETIVKQDQDGDYFYVIISGKCQVTREAPGHKSLPLAELTPGSYFGEEALIADTQRNATVTMLTDGRLMRLSKQDFRSLLNDPISRRISFDDAQKLVSSGRAKWLDVRLPSEYAAQHLPDSINMPLYLLRMKFNTLDKKIAHIVYCDTSSRSSAATFVLIQKGFDAYVLDKGIPPQP
jgi:CRP-like cAMP-binding protein